MSSNGIAPNKGSLLPGSTIARQVGSPVFKPQFNTADNIAFNYSTVCCFRHSFFSNGKLKLFLN
jgi:hypothetical protein